MAEFWTYVTASVTRVAEVAQQIEADGWDGVLFLATRSLRMDVLTLELFEQYVKDVAACLAAGRVPPGELPRAGEPAEGWLRGRDPGELNVPVEVAASGPWTLAIGALHADIVSLAVGADEARLKWGIDTVREAARVTDITAIGFGRVYLSMPGRAAREAYPGECAISDKLMAEEVLPALKAAS
jgi:5,10-methylenetetrahydromethanopterin reductase